LTLVSIVVPHSGDPGRARAVVRAATRIREEDVEVILVLASPTPQRVSGDRRVKVVYQSILRHPGRGVAMRDGYYFSDGEVVVYLDSNTDRAEPHRIRELYRPILDGHADIVKAGFSRRFQGVEGEVRALLAKLYPGLKRVEHPLSPYTAAKRKALSVVEWEPGWGADIAILIDTYSKGFRVAESSVDLKERSKGAPQLYRESIEEIVGAIVRRGLRDGRIEGVEAEKLARELLERVGGAV